MVGSVDVEWQRKGWSLAVIFRASGAVCLVNGSGSGV